MPEADRTGVGVRRLAVGHPTAAEHLGYGSQVGVEFQSYDRLVCPLILHFQVNSTSRLECPTSHSSIAAYLRRMLESVETVMASMEREDFIRADERPHLIVLRGPSLGDFFALEGESLVLGSDPFRADVIVRDVEVSPRHAKIRREPGSCGYVIRGLGTGREIYVNDEVLEGE